MSKRFLLPLVVLAAALASAWDKAENWFQVRSPHFTVITNSSDKQGRRIAGQFERMRALFQAAFPKLQVDPEHPIIVLAVHDKNDFRALEPQSYLADGSLQLTGLFLRASDQNYVLLRLDADGPSPYAVVYHEYTHWLLSKAPNVPLWLDEGMAEFYANTQIYDKDATLGWTNARDLMLLRETPLVPLETLFSVDANSPAYRDRENGSVFYAESWSLVHYLYFRDVDYKTSRLTDYMDLLAQNVDPVSAASRAFGDLKHLQTALEHYVQQSTFNHVRSTGISRVDDLAFEAEPMPMAKVNAVKANVLAYNGRAEEARVLLDEVLRDDPDNASARDTTTFLDSLQQREQEDKLRDAIRSSPLTAPNYDKLAVFLWLRNRNLEEARKLEGKAIGLEPSNVAYPIDLSKILLAMGRGQEAVEVLREAGKIARTPQAAATVSDLLRDAQGYAEVQAEERRLAAAARNPGSEEKPESPRSSDGDTFVAQGPHRYLVGVLRDVRCESARMDLKIEANGKQIELHAENYYKVEYSTLNLPPLKELKPCEELEGRPARVEYVEPADRSEVARVLAVELHK